MKKLIMIAIVLVIARSQVATSCVVWPPWDCRNMGEVLWEFTDDGCEPTSEEYDPAYCYYPVLPNPTFGTRYADGGPVWTWSGGVYTVNEEDSLCYAIPERNDQLYLRQYFEVVHTLVESEDPSLIGLGLELWDMSETEWPGCPEGYQQYFPAGDTGYLGGYEFPAPTWSVDLGGGWYRSTWVSDFSTDGSVGEDYFPGLFDATHATAIIGMSDLDATGFQIDEVYIKMVWHDYSGGITPDEFWYCTCFGPPPPPPPPPKPVLEFAPDFDYLCEPQDIGGPPPECPDTGTVDVRLSWQPEEPDAVHVLVDPNPDSETAPNPDLILPASTEPNGVVRLVFNQANYHEWQTVVMQAVADIEKEGNENHLVRFSTQTSGDPNFDGYKELRSNPIIDNDIPYIIAEPDDIEGQLSENNPGVPVCVNVSLSHMPDSEVEIRGEIASDFETIFDMVVMDPNFEEWTDPNHLLFSPANYSIPQQICLEARDDEELVEEGLEWVPGTINLWGLSDDIWYQSIEEGGELEDSEVDFNIQDNECGAWGYNHVDVNKDCYVNLGDFALFYEQWLMCVQPYSDGCDKLWNLLEEE
ncbi:MAG TPA: hypothetical protein HPP87_07940 [Planctomycetes bacterium]|nr:hypothetical protein [Planctomycetota bacterium]